jgi:PEP-CTERM motif
MRRKIWCFATALAALLSTAAANATPIEYSFSGMGDWTLDGLGDSGDFVVNLTADTSKILVQPGQYVVQVSGTFSSGGSIVAFTEGGPVAFNEVIDETTPPGAMLFAQVPGIGSVAGLGLTNSLFETYDLSHALPLTSGTPELVSTPFFTSGGPLELLSISAVRFQATIVPEPSTWAMLLLGFGLIGFTGFWRGRMRPAI